MNESNDIRFAEYWISNTSKKVLKYKGIVYVDSYVKSF